MDLPTEITNEKFSFGAKITKVYKSKSGKRHILAIASDTLPDLHKDRMGATAIHEMVAQARAGLPILDTHTSSTVLSKTVDAFALPVKVQGHDTIQLVVDIEVDERYPTMMDLYDEVEKGTETGQLSIGGRIDRSHDDEAVAMELWGENTIRVIKHIKLNHISRTREDEAANPRSGFVDAVIKGIMGGDTRILPSDHSECWTPSDELVKALSETDRSTPEFSDPTFSLLRKAMQDVGLRTFDSFESGCPTRTGATSPEVATPSGDTTVMSKTSKLDDFLSKDKETPADQDVAQGISAGSILAAFGRVMGEEGVDAPESDLSKAISELDLSTQEAWEAAAVAKALLENALLKSDAVDADRKMLTFAVPFALLEDGMSKNRSTQNGELDEIVQNSVVGVAEKLSGQVEGVETQVSKTAEVDAERYALIEKRLAAIEGEETPPQGLQGSEAPDASDSEEADSDVTFKDLFSSARNKA